MLRVEKILDAPASSLILSSQSITISIEDLRSDEGGKRLHTINSSRAWSLKSASPISCPHVLLLARIQNNGRGRPHMEAATGTPQLSPNYTLTNRIHGPVLYTSMLDSKSGSASYRRATKMQNDNAQAKRNWRLASLSNRISTRKNLRTRAGAHCGAERMLSLLQARTSWCKLFSDHYPRWRTN